MKVIGHPGYDDDSQYPDDTPPRCGGTGMVAYWDGSAYAGEMCRGCLDCDPHDATCESEMTSHGRTPCRCLERRNGVGR